MSKKYINVEVDIGWHTESVAIEDIIEQISTEDLAAELLKRKQAIPADAGLDDVQAALLRGRPNEALILLNRIIGARDFTIDPSAYERSIKNRDPETGRPLIA